MSDEFAEVLMRTFKSSLYAFENAARYESEFSVMAKRTEVINHVRRLADRLKETEQKLTAERERCDEVCKRLASRLHYDARLCCSAHLLVAAKEIRSGND